MLRAESLVIFSESDVNSKLMEGYERAESKHGVPYYINHAAERTQWDHPVFQKTMEELVDLNNIKYAAYRTASKLQLLQKRLKLDQLDLHTVSTMFDRHGFGMHTDLTMEILELDAILTDICRKTKKDRAAIFDPDLAAELILNLLMNMFDPHRRGTIRAVSCKLALATLCSARLGEKYKFYFRHVSENGTMIMREKFRQFLRDMMAIPEIMKESRPFGGSKNLEAAVDECFRAVANGIGLHEELFHDWLYQEPQCLVWLHTMHRMNAAQSVTHSSKCATCRVIPIVGFRYKCLKCFKYNLCQQCFFTSKTSKRHKITHPIQEYCLNATSKEDTKSFVKMIRNNIVRDYKRRSQIARYTVTPDVDQSLAWDDYAPGIADQNEDVVQDQEGLHRAESVDDDVISYLGLDPRHSRIIYPDDEDEMPQYIVKTEISEASASGDERPKSISSSVEEAKSLNSPSGSVLLTGSHISHQRPVSPPPIAPNDGDDGLTLPADKVKQLYRIIYQLEDENKVLLDELEDMQDAQSEMVSLSDTREQFEKMKLREEVYQARQEILESHNQRLMKQIQKLRALVENQADPYISICQTDRPTNPSVTQARSSKFALMSTPKDTNQLHVLKTPTFASPVFADALRTTVDCDLTASDDDDSVAERRTNGTSVNGLPAMSMLADADELDSLVRKLNEEMPEEYSRYQYEDATEETTTSDRPIDAARLMGEAMSQFVDKLQVDAV